MPRHSLRRVVPYSISSLNTAKKTVLPPPAKRDATVAWRRHAAAVTAWLSPAGPPAATGGEGEMWGRGRGRQQVVECCMNIPIIFNSHLIIKIR
jgi:hypothetical protein